MIKQPHHTCERSQDRLKVLFVDQLSGPKMEDLPMELTTKILLKLPVQSLFHCRSVCKTWCRIIDSPRFSDLHFDSLVLNVNNPSISSSLIVVPTTYEGEMCFVDDSNRLKLSKINLPIPKNGELSLVGSSNGLLCISSSSLTFPDCFFICNPAIREYTRLLVPMFLGRYVYKSGFGFDPSTKEFKIVLLRMWNEGLENLLSDFLVYTLGGSNSWRYVEGIQTGLSVDDVSQSSMVSICGCLHWLCSYEGVNMEIPMGIISFDLEHEKVGIVPNPEFSSDSTPSYSDFDGKFELGELGGCLSLSDCSLVDRYEIWVMKDYNVKESWTKQFVIRKYMMGQLSFSVICPIYFRKNGELLLLCDSLTLVSHNLENGLLTQLEDIDMLNLDGSYQAFPYFGTLISPSVHDIENNV